MNLNFILKKLQNNTNEKFAFKEMFKVEMLLLRSNQGRRSLFGIVEDEVATEVEHVPNGISLYNVPPKCNIFRMSANEFAND
jgi:hypothetical protein